MAAAPLTDARRARVVFVLAASTLHAEAITESGDGDRPGGSSLRVRLRSAEASSRRRGCVGTGWRGRG